MSEILAPAGGKNSAIAAINSGADALYLGLSSFSARSSAENFDIEGFKEISALSRAFGVKIYVAMNTLIKNSELDGFLKTLIEVWNAGADAIILSDIFLGKFIKRNYPQIVLHLSTQAGVCNTYGARLAKKYGFDRVILSRETSIEDIKSIAKIIETEVFVQGALCTCFSGQCYLSSFAGGNSGNRGKCKQPCRKLYSIDREGFENQAYRLSLSDLSVGQNIRELAAAGVKSFKIEGRMRRPEYVAAAVKYYKNLLEGSQNGRDLSDLKRTFNRGNYTKGLAFGQDKSFISSAVQGHIGEFIGVIKVEKGKFICASSQNFVKGDAFKILRDGREVGGADFAENCKNGFVLTSKTRLLNGDKVFITTDTTVNAELLSAVRKLPIEVSAEFCAGKRAKVVINGTVFESENLLEEAKSRPLSADDVKNCFNKVDKYPFDVTFGEIITDGVFIAASELNAFRRTAYAGFYDKITKNTNPQITENHEISAINREKCDKTAAICRNFEGVSADIAILKPDDYSQTSATGKYLYLPPYMTDGEIEKIKPIIEQSEGIYCEGTWGIELAAQTGKKLFAGCGFNISNSVAVSECEAGYITLSKELSYSELSELCTTKTFALSAGGIKVMDLIYCPFGKRCKDCDGRNFYTLTDDAGRKFPLRRYKTGECRFELYNCAYLSGSSPTGTLVDCTLEKRPEKLIKISKDEKKLTEYFKNHTRGHFNSPVL